MGYPNKLVKSFIFYTIYNFYYNEVFLGEIDLWTLVGKKRGIRMGWSSQDKSTEMKGSWNSGRDRRTDLRLKGSVRKNMGRGTGGLLNKV